MNTVEIKGKKREAIGKKDSKALRNQGNVPCVMYGGEEAIHFYAEAGEFRKIVYTPNVYLINLDIDGVEYKAVMQDIQYHPVDEQILHIDFLQIFDDKEVKLEVPVKVTGFAKGIRAGGKLSIEIRRLKLRALPKNLPDNIEIDVTELELDQSIRVSDLEMENVEFLNSPSVPVVRVMITRAARAANDAGETVAEEETAEE